MSRALLAAGGGLAGCLGAGLFLSSPPPKDTRERVTPRTAVVIGGGVRGASARDTLEIHISVLLAEDVCR